MTTPSLNPWQPSADQPWDVRRVWHLHRRAGFAANWSQLEQDLKEGPDAAIGRVFAATSEQFEQMSAVIAGAAMSSDNIDRLKAWWLYRMLFSPSPLVERLTLTWHNHFATGGMKVDNVGLMWRQNVRLRQCALGAFGTLLSQLLKDPALLIWLDANSNRKEHPNENLARESMELFALGVGNYSEEDVKQAARALTGWTVQNGEFIADQDHHDTTEKTIFQKTGAWSGDDFVNMLIEHPATSRRVSFRICEQMMGESTLTNELVDGLAAGLREHNLDIAWAVERLLRSEAFFAAENIGNRVSSPAEFVIGTARSLECTDPPPSTLLLSEWTARLGQNLFCPPNVFGWPGGRTWLSSRTLVARANFAGRLICGELTSGRKAMKARELAERHGFTSDQDVRTFYSQLMLGKTDLPAALRQCDLDGLPLAILTSPEAQLA